MDYSGFHIVTKGGDNDNDKKNENIALELLPICAAIWLFCNNSKLRFCPLFTRARVGFVVYLRKLLEWGKSASARSRTDNIPRIILYLIK
jgi:hypothetical protein